MCGLLFGGPSILSFFCLTGVFLAAVSTLLIEGIKQVVSLS